MTLKLHKLEHKNVVRSFSSIIIIAILYVARQVSHKIIYTSSVAVFHKFEGFNSITLCSFLFSSKS